MHRVSSILIVVLLFIQSAAPSLVAQPSAPYRTQIAEFEEFVKQQMAVDKIPGLSVGFIKGDFMWTKGFGFADLENKTPAHSESMYRMASVAKPMTATAVLQLAERGKLNLDAEVQTYVPYFPKKQFPVTVRQLLGHLGGISHYRDYEKEGRFKDYKNTRQSIAVFENFDLVSEPGTRYNYSSYGYNLLGAVIEGASGQSYGEYMTENIWRPLGMTATRLDSPNDLIPNRVRGYRLAGNTVRNSEFVDISSRFAAGGIRSNVVEMLRFGNGIHEGKVLSKASLELMYDSMTTKTGELTYYSAGWGTAPINGRFSISHSGGQQETSTFLFSFPSRNLTIAIAANLESADNMVYIQRLFTLITGEAWNVGAYLTDRSKQPFFQTMQGIFDEGRSQFERKQKAFSDDPKELAEAFTAINKLVNAESFKTDLAGTRQKLNEARNATGGRKFAKIGSFMAQKLKESGADLSAYSNLGAVAFFADYIALYQKDTRLPSELRFNESFEQIAVALNESWRKTNTAEIRKQNFNASTDFDLIGKMLRTTFANTEIYPNLAPQMNNTARSFYLSGNSPQALKVSGLAAEFYPQAEAVNTLFGIIQILSGQKEKGVEYLKKAVAINPQGDASANGLNRAAYQLLAVNRADDGLELLKTAVGLYPNEANLYDSIADFYMQKNVKDKALEFYQKALAVDPNYANAANAREMIKRLKEE